MQKQKLGARENGGVRILKGWKGLKLGIMNNLSLKERPHAQDKEKQ